MSGLKKGDLAIIINGHCPCTKRNIGAIVECNDSGVYQGEILWSVVSATRPLIDHPPMLQDFPFSIMADRALHYEKHLKKIDPKAEDKGTVDYLYKGTSDKKEALQIKEYERKLKEFAKEWD